MATISQLQEDFTGAPVGSDILGANAFGGSQNANTIFVNVSGAGTSKFIVDPFDSSLRMMEVVVSGATTKIHEMDFPATGILWFSFDLDIEVPFDTNTAILNGYLNNTALATDKIFDLQIVANSRVLRLRDVNSQVWLSGELLDNTKYRVFFYVKTGAPKAIRVMVYSGQDFATLAQDSGEIASTATPATISHLRLGAISSATGTVRFGRLRGDNAVQPIPPSSASVSLGSDQTVETGDTVTVPITTGGSGTLVITQTSGPTVTVTGTGPNRFFVMPGTITGGIPKPTTVTLQATYGGASDIVNITAPAWPDWIKMADGSRKPVVERLYA